MKSAFVPLRRSVSRSVYALAALLAVAIAWAYVTRIDISVRARGIVRPQGDPIRIVSEVGGRIKQIPVTEGSMVLAGDALLQLDSHDLLLKKRALETRVHFTELRLADIRRQLSDAASLEEQSASVDSFDRDAAKRAAHTNLESARLHFARMDLLFREGLIARQAHDESRIALTQAEQEEFRLTSKVLDRKRSQSLARMHDLEASATPIRSELAALYHDLIQINVDIGQLTITSPASGQVTSLAAVHPGEILAAGAAIAAVVPSFHSLMVESWLPTSDRNYVNPGQLVRLQSDSSGSNHGDAFDARVFSISPDARFNESLVGTYRVLIMPGVEAPDLRLGMTFDVHFVTREQQLLWVLFNRVRREFN